MDLIFGGAYQGKLEYAKEAFNIKEEEIFYCSKDTENTVIDFSAKVVYSLENFTLACAKTGIEAKEYLMEHREELRDKIIICTDISQGVVPMDKELRAWREMNGRTIIYLSKEADNVTRVFCGLPQTLKNEKSSCQGSYIHLIRHGTTEGNIKRWYYGKSDIPLTEEGRELILTLRKEGIYPEGENADFYTSGLLRTEQTFDIIFGKREHNIIKELEEMSFGDYEKHSYEELKNKPDYLRWIEDETGSLAPPNGESPRLFRERVLIGFKKLVKAHKIKELSAVGSKKEAHSIAVCHGGVISAIMAQYFPREDMHFFSWIPEPGHGYTIRIQGGNIKDYIKF